MTNIGGEWGFAAVASGFLLFWFILGMICARA
jgi:hypothetical protein